MNFTGGSSSSSSFSSLSSHDTKDDVKSHNHDIESIINGHDRDDDDTSVYSYVLLQLEDQLEQQFRHPQHPTYHPSARRRVHPHHDHGQLDNSFSISIVTASSAWQYIPSDVIYLIASHLDGRSLARLSSCDRTCRSVINQHQQRGVTLWRHLTTDIMKAKWHAQWMNTTIQREIRHQMNSARNAHLTSESDPRSYYAMRYSITVKQRHQMRRSMEDQRRREIEMKHVAKGRWIEEVTIPNVFMILLIVFLAFLTIELHFSSGTAHVSFLTMWPLIVIISINLLSFIHLFFLRWITSRTIPSSEIYNCISSSNNTLTISPYWYHSRSLMKLLIELVEGGRMSDAITTNQKEVFRTHLSLLTSILSFTAWLLLLTLKVTDTISSLSWNIVWLPLYLMFSIIISGIRFFHWFRPTPFDPDIAIYNMQTRGCVRWKPMLCLVLPLFFFLFIHLYLIHLIPRLLYTLLPLTLLHFAIFLFLLTLVIDVCRLKDGDNEMNRLTTDRVFNCLLGCAMILGWLLLPAPLLVTQILLTIKVDGHDLSLSWNTIFIPSFISFSLLTITVLAFTHSHHNKLKHNQKQVTNKTAAPIKINFNMPEV